MSWVARARGWVMELGCVQDEVLTSVEEDVGLGCSHG